MKKIICVVSVFLLVSALFSCGEECAVASKSGGKTVMDVLNEKTAESAAKETEKISEETESKAPEAESVNAEAKQTFPSVKNGDIDVDLTLLNASMAYAQVNDMLMYPDRYTGKKVRMRGTFYVFPGDERNYFCVVITDATACCSQGIEFILAEERKYPSEYPSEGDEITVTGFYHTYPEGQIMYPELYDAVIE